MHIKHKSLLVVSICPMENHDVSSAHLLTFYAPRHNSLFFFFFSLSLSLSLHGYFLTCLLWRCLSSPTFLPWTGTPVRIHTALYQLHLGSEQRANTFLEVDNMQLSLSLQYFTLSFFSLSLGFAWHGRNAGRNLKIFFSCKLIFFSWLVCPRCHNTFKVRICINWERGRIME